MTHKKGSTEFTDEPALKIRVKIPLKISINFDLYGAIRSALCP